MNFHSRKAIYEQIGDYLCSRILSGEWKEDAKLPSVRELAVTLQVNPNTVMRTCLLLEERKIIYNQRGVGLFVAKKGREKALRRMRDDFEKNDIPILAKTLQTLGIDIRELEALLNKQI